MDSLRLTVSVIILNYNGAQHLPTCIESLQAQTLADQLEIIIADNGSTGNSEQVVRPYGVQRFIDNQ